MSSWAMNPPQSTSPSQTDEQRQQQQQEQILQDQPHLRRLTADEMRIMRECNRESFYYRSIPFAVAGVLGVRYLTRLGYIKVGPPASLFWKYAAAVTVGYLAGKISYMGKCRQKFMSLPNSELGEALRQKYGGGKRQFEVLQEIVSLPEIGGSSDQGFSPNRDGSDMYTNPDFNVPSGSKPEQPAQKPSTTYDELRRKNREEYLRQQFGVAPGPGQTQQPPNHQHPPSRESQSPPYGSTPQQQPTSAPKSGSKYGDVDFK